jgi:hypothetical protein
MKLFMGTVETSVLFNAWLHMSMMKTSDMPAYMTSRAAGDHEQQLMRLIKIVLMKQSRRTTVSQLAIANKTVVSHEQGIADLRY